MTKIDTIIAEIERLNKELYKQRDFRIDGSPIPVYDTNAIDGMLKVLDEVKGFINSLPTEQPSEDLEKKIESYLTTNRQYAGGDEENVWGDDCIRDAIKHGSNWQKERMMKNCLYDTEVILHTVLNNREYLTLANDKLPHVPVSYGLNVGDKVKILIIKEDEQ